jgi:lipid-A-disaccharide synthase-like uncharacterized protein
LTLVLFWKIFGFIGQILFGARFLVQWLASEKVKKSIIPNSFWILSLSGGIILFIYAIHIKDPVFIVGQGLGLFIYARNLFFVKTKPKAH